MSDRWMPSAASGEGKWGGVRRLVMFTWVGEWVRGIEVYYKR